MPNPISMKKRYTLIVLVFLLSSVVSLAQNIVGGRMKEIFARSIISSSGIGGAWELTYGPDDSLWITDAANYKVYKMSPAGGTKRMILDISLKSTFLGTAPGGDSTFNLQFTWSKNSPQGGLAGMAIHPQFMSGKPYVYIDYVRDSIRKKADSTGNFYKRRVARFTYNFTSGRLQSPIWLCDTLPGSSDHNSQRLLIAPVNGVSYLFCPVGDMGAGQLANTFRTNNAQNTGSYEGKILRFNLEPDMDPGSYDQWIPDDNPFNGAKESAVWAVGFRNNQGLAFDSVRNILYGSSHGPYSDDELNVIKRAKNYGHPLVIGYSGDHNYDGSSAGAYKPGVGYVGTLPPILDEQHNADSIGSSYQDPLYSTHTAYKDSIHNIYINPPSNATWPSEALSGLGLYNYSTIPGWKNSLFVAGLKWGRMLRLKLNPTGDSVRATGGSDTLVYFDGDPRYRDMAFGPGGKDIYISMEGSSSNFLNSNNPALTACAGCIQKFTFLGYADSSGYSTISPLVNIAKGKISVCEDANVININSINKNLWVPITDTSGNIVAEINANGNLLGNVTTSVFTNGGAVREQPANKTLYLDRNLTITPQVQPSTPVSIRLYLTNAEFDALKNASNSQSQPSGVTSIGNLSIFKNTDICNSSLSNSANAIVTSKQQAFGTDGYVVQADISSFSSFYFANAASLLPVRSLTFNGSLNKNIGQLRWVTEEEKATKFFTVERSINSRDFFPLGTQLASNSGGQALYTYADSGIAQLTSPVIYYRLKLTDADGRISYSSVITLKKFTAASLINVHPNPVVNEFTVNINAAVTEKASWQITDINGKPVMQRPISLIKGDNETNINISHLPAGVYYLQVIGANINQGVKLQKL